MSSLLHIHYLQELTCILWPTVWLIRLSETSLRNPYSNSRFPTLYLSGFRSLYHLQVFIFDTSIMLPSSFLWKQIRRLFMYSISENDIQLSVACYLRGKLFGWFVPSFPPPILKDWSVNFSSPLSLSCCNYYTLIALICQAIQLIILKLSAFSDFQKQIPENLPQQTDASNHRLFQLQYLPAW